ncbi:hypothetical protein L5515_009852 [Caenorhabditis briggsae]|uniref:G-protein coupled receptors family 1 profile domain-containing protein n=1 Tax=Caenorhabditis briggsae TaxID=6238 RepID=A0AAE9F9X7_CAEBR|nr:hypothetical protein L5515_009852 [Caenorhabditis briggsae]
MPVLWSLLPSQTLFLITIIFFLLYDGTLLGTVIHKRFFKKEKGPFAYIVYMTSCGLISKVSILFMVVAWPIVEFLNIGYEVYRQAVGELVTLIFTFSYLFPMFISLLMTIHRIVIFVTPMKAARFFNEAKLLIYSSLIAIVILVWLLIPFYSDCTMNFKALTSRLESACNPERHPITLFQNMYLIYVPFGSVALMVVYLVVRKFSNKNGSDTTNHQVKRETAMIRQVSFIVIYLSVYELIYLHLRWFPEHFESFPIEIQSMSYMLRLFAIASLNFMVYFVVTKSTRRLFLNAIGWKESNKVGVTAVSASVT